MNHISINHQSSQFMSKLSNQWTTINS